MPTAAMKKMKKTELPNDTAASGSQRQRVAAAVAADHQVVGELHQHLPQLGENYR